MENTKNVWIFVALLLIDFVASRPETLSESINQLNKRESENQNEIPDNSSTDVVSAINRITLELNGTNHPFTRLHSGGDAKKAVVLPNITEISNFRGLIRGIVNGNVAPAIRVIFSNLDRDLFKIFTPTTAPETATDYHVVFQSGNPSDAKKTTTVTPVTLPPNSTNSEKTNVRNLGQGSIATPIEKYKIRAKTTVATSTGTTTNPIQPQSVTDDDEEDDEDEDLRY